MPGRSSLTSLHLRHHQLTGGLQCATIAKRVQDSCCPRDVTPANEEVGVTPRSQSIWIAEVGERRALHQQRADVGRGQRDVHLLQLASTQRLDDDFMARCLDQRLADRCRPPVEHLRLVQPRSQQREHAVTCGAGEKLHPLRLAVTRRPVNRLSA